MKIAIMGSAPSSMSLAPFGDPEWKIWGCSPGLYPNCPRVDAWFELHRWEPPVIGKPQLQKPWFSPEYVAWMGQQKLVWMQAKVPEIPGSDVFPARELVNKFGNFFMTSSISWMMAMAIDQILLEREQDPDHDRRKDAIGLFGVDMAATEEYGYQRAGCQFFIQTAVNLGIEIVVPPESDLTRPMPLYGVSEGSHYIIKATQRMRELQGRRQQCMDVIKQTEKQLAFLDGAIDDLNYHIQTWHQEPESVPLHVGVWNRSPFLTDKGDVSAG